jgi:hypothetical protein
VVDSRETNGDGRDPEVERYREAALHALDQLEWCVEYLYGIRKSGIAKAISAQPEADHGAHPVAGSV